MSKLASGATFQIKMAFMDEDLKRPKHDEIMFWLTEWVKQPANVRSLVPQLPHRRITVADHRLEPDAEAAIKGQGGPWQGFPYGEHETKQNYRREPWPHEPEPRLLFKSAQWELPLKENNRTVAFADLVANYDYCQYLSGRNTTFHMAERIEDSSSRRVLWKYPETRTIHTFAQTLDTVSIVFEVKTSILSVGDLMRQLNYYRETSMFKEHRREDSIPPILVVVAPANPEAEGVCKAHGIGFVRYERSNSTVSNPEVAANARSGFPDA